MDVVDVAVVQLEEEKEEEEGQRSIGSDSRHSPASLRWSPSPHLGLGVVGDVLHPFPWPSTTAIRIHQIRDLLLLLLLR